MSRPALSNLLNQNANLSGEMALRIEISEDSLVETAESGWQDPAFASTRGGKASSDLYSAKVRRAEAQDM